MKGGHDAVYRFPQRVRDVVGARGGGVGGFGECSGYLFRGEGGVFRVVHAAEERGSWGFGGKKLVEKGFRHLGRIGGPW